MIVDVQQVPLADHSSLSRLRLRRTVYATRKRARIGHEEDGVYTSLESLVIPPVFCCNRCESILLADTGADKNRILALGVQRHISLIAETTAILGDGTFRVAQQHVLHITLQGFSIPVMYFLLPGMTKPMYRKVLEIAHQVAPDVAHQSWVFDFECSMVRAREETFPEGTCWMFLPLQQSDFAKD